MRKIEKAFFVKSLTNYCAQILTRCIKKKKKNWERLRFKKGLYPLK